MKIVTFGIELEESYHLMSNAIVMWFLRPTINPIVCHIKQDRSTVFH